MTRTQNKTATRAVLQLWYCYKLTACNNHICAAGCTKSLEMDNTRSKMSKNRSYLPRHGARETRVKYIVGTILLFNIEEESRHTIRYSAWLASVNKKKNEEDHRSNLTNLRNVNIFRKFKKFSQYLYDKHSMYKYCKCFE